MMRDSTPEQPPETVIVVNVDDPRKQLRERESKTLARQSEPLQLLSLVQCQGTRWSTSKEELEGAALLICSECQTNSDTCLPSAVKTGSRSET